MFFWNALSKKFIFKSVVLSLLLAGIAIKPIFGLFFPDKAYDGRNIAIKMSAWILLAFFFLLVMLVVSKALIRFGFFSQNDKETKVLALLVSGFLLIYLMNNVSTTLDMKMRKYSPVHEPFKVLDPIGNDFRIGIYRPMQEIFINRGYFNFIVNPDQLRVYTPFTAIFFSPLMLLNEDQAYFVEVYLSIAALMAGVMLSGLLLSRNTINKTQILLLISLVAFYVFTSRYFILMIERGNIDGIVFFLMVLFIYAVITWPEKVWLHVLLLSLTVHLKIYPALLFLFLFIRYGKKIILPLLTWNTIFALALGPTSLANYIKYMMRYSQYPEPWIGNHSAASFAWFASDLFPVLKDYQLLLKVILLVFPSIVFIFGIMQIRKHIKNDNAWLYYLGLSAYMMCFIPAVSHDYKLVLLSASLIVMTFLLYRQMISEFTLETLLEVLLCFVVLTIFHRSHKHMPEQMALIGNHYLPMLAMLIYTVARIKFSAQPEPGKALL